MLKAAGALTGLTIAAMALGSAGPMVLSGAAAMLVMSASLFIAAKAIKEFQDIKPDDMEKAGLALLGLTGAVLSLGALMASGLGAAALMLGVGALLAMGGAVYVVAQSLKALQDAVGGGKLDTLGTDLGKGLTAITTGLQDVDFGDLEDTFDELEDAFAELDLDQLLAFSQLAGAKLGDAASSLMDGIKKLTNMESGEGNMNDIDFSKFATQLKTRLKPLEKVNDVFEDVIAELDIAKLQELSKVSGEGLKNAIGGLMDAIKAITEMDFGGLKLDSLFGDSITSILSDLEDVFDNLESAIAELNFDQLKQFGDSVGVNLGAAAKNIVTGINEMAQITTPVATVGGSVKDAFRQFNIIIAGLNVKAFTAFAELAKTDLGKAMNDFIASLQNVGTNIGPTTFQNGEVIRKAFLDFNTAIGSLKIEPGALGSGGDGLLAFAKLADVNLSDAATNLKAGMDKLSEEFKHLDATASQYNFEGVRAAFVKLNAVIKDINLDAFDKLGKLAEAKIGDASLAIKTGLEGMREAFKGQTAENYSFLDQIKLIFDKIATVFSPDSAAGKSITTLEAFAKSDFSKFGEVITNFKKGLEQFTELEKITVDFSENGAIAKLFKAVSGIFTTPDGKPLNIENLVKFGEADFSKMKGSINGLDQGLRALNEVGIAYTGANFEPITTFLDNASKAFSGENINKLIDFAGKDFSKLPDSAKALGEGIAAILLIPLGQKATYDTLQQDFSALSLAISYLNLASLGEVSNAAPLFKKLGTAFINLKTALGSFAGLNIAQEIAQLKELSNIDASKLVTLSEAIIKLSDSFVVLAKAIKEMGDITPVVKISDQMLKLHESVAKNPMNAEKLAEGVGAIFSGLMGSLVSFVEGGGQGVSNSFFKGSTGVANDMVSLPGASRMFTGPEGTININDKDTIIAGTNLFGESTLPVEKSLEGKHFEKFLEKMNEMIQASKTQKPDSQSPIVIQNVTTLDGKVVASNTETVFKNNKVRI